MPHTCGGVRRADNGALGTSDAVSVIAIVRTLIFGDAGRSYAVVPAKAGTHNHGPLLLRESRRPASSKKTAAAYGSPLSRGRRGGKCFSHDRHHLPQPATSLMRAISSSTAFS